MKILPFLTTVLLSALISTGQAAPAGAPNRAPDWTLERADQVTQIIPNQWSGPADLSARVWLWREGTGDERALMLRADVSDDVWVQPFVGEQAWQADGLQVGLGVPGARDWWEVGLSKWPEGGAAAHVFRAVPGLRNPFDVIQVTATPRAGGMIYQARFPLKSLGFSDELLATTGIRFNLLVNDRDQIGEGGARETTLQIAPGIGGDKDAKPFPIVKFAPSAGGAIQISAPLPDPPPPASYSITDKLTTQTVAGPQWAKTLPIYEANLDHYYTRPGDAIANLERALPSLQAMGAGIIWLMPIYPRGQLKAFGSSYAVRDYYGVNPDLGSADDLRSLIGRAHALGMFVILDWVPLHSAWDNPWITAHPDFYNLDDKGEVRQIGPWQDVARFNYGAPGQPNLPLWNAMRDAMLYWVREFKVDGYRADVAGDVPVEFWNWMRPQLDELRPVFMLAEAQKPELHPAFDMSYAWTMENWGHDLARGKTNARDLDQVLRDEAQSFPAGAILMRFVVNHDTANRPQEFPVPAGGSRALAVLSATLPGKPMFYSGQEAGLTEKSIDAPAANAEFKEAPIVPFYTTLLGFYRAHPALQSGDFTKIESSQDDAIYAFARQRANDRVVVMVNLSAQAQTFELRGDAATRFAGTYADIFDGAAHNVAANAPVTLPAWGSLVLAGQS